MYIPTWLLVLLFLYFIFLQYSYSKTSKENHRIRVKYNAVAHSTRGWWNRLNGSVMYKVYNIDTSNLEDINSELGAEFAPSIDITESIELISDLKGLIEDFRQLPVMHEYDE
ncbi:hypothetical protein [Erwinia sp. SLM-02]|uniref:hypothetical protein n=1 Tax=Erwinia sp. SLM-02 TaxID=3020057 RepID=UPI0030805C7C